MATIDKLWSLAAALRLTHEAVIKTLFVANELTVASIYAQEETRRQLELLRNFAPEQISSLVARRERNLEEARALRRTAIEQARTLSSGLHGSVLSLTSQGTLATSLRNQNLSGHDLLRLPGEETEHSCLFIPAASTSQAVAW